MFVEESIHEGMQCVVFEPNKEGRRVSETESSLRPCAAMPFYLFVGRIFLVDLAIPTAVVCPWYT